MYYENGFDYCYDELITFYPVFYKDIFEMNEILKAYGNLLNALQKNIDTMLNDNYIQTADEETIERLEKYLYINIDKTKNIEERRKFVLSFFIGFGNISASKIKAIINSYTNAEVYVRFIKVDEAGNNCLNITFDRGIESNININDILSILNRKIPAHILFELSMKYIFECSENNKNYFGIGEKSLKRNVVFDSGLRGD